MNELVKKLFEGVEGLSPEFLERADTLIAVAIAEEADKRVQSETQTINESFDSKLAQAKEEFVTESVFRIDSFLDKALVEWAKENAVALDAIAKVELAENFLTGFKNLFTEASITIPKGDEKSIVEGLQAKLVEAEGKLEEAEGKLAEQAKIAEAQKRADILKELTAGLAETTAERVTQITKDFAMTEEAEFRKKVGYVVEALGGKIADAGDKGDSGEGGDDKTVVDPAQADDPAKVVETTEVTPPVVTDPWKAMLKESVLKKTK
ncbi:hypothetical protein [Ralstonia phage RSP15]|uniref:hypothetical protein n=1 Tax=Ralstonia phage RSP15 TaxID=1785960 RepID=UPI00074D3671|nr:hypothetical protein BH754_gp030 [Ralstonia phage RSP15]BAU39988.1 hypothetical protein [Ralstonia phage RSP15]